MKCAIVGLGLMGGSMGITLKECGIFEEIAGFDKNQIHQIEAQKLSLVDKLIEFDEIKNYDVIILAIPVEAIISILQNLKDIKSDTTIIDLGSTKEQIVVKTPLEIRKNLVASHPMTGTEKFGPTAAIKSLYENKVVVLCDLEDSGELQRDLAIYIFSKLKMRIQYMKAYEHDRHAAFISHLPHAISYALANSVLSQEEPQSILTLAAGGFKDMSRIAKSSPIMWSDIFKQNKNFVIESIEIFENELKKAKCMIKDENYEELEEWMKKAATLHNIL
ncbi:MAG: prephenate dehydrogenase [Campylobacterales bacterium]|nr:prephenate dehydrogenase [Campylobacterales bacterium]